ncbi:hypothetical protein SDC9_181052 [bioreactor metagenome]|uniref:Uncharacterized protein n=1 Tax=bioreactor metagenome TaxID=1076179 RepID=A0A645HCQ0_9ZZZZ
MGRQFFLHARAYLFAAPASQQEQKIVAAGIHALQGRICLIQAFGGVVDGASVVGREHEKADGLVAVNLCHVPHGKEVVQGFGHLLVIDIDVSVVQPEAGEGLAVGALRLGNLVFMVREG